MLLAWTLTLISTVAGVSNRSAPSRVFFGFDNVPYGVARPNHDAAKTSFLSHVGTAGSLDMERLPLGNQSTPVSFGNVANGVFAPGTESGVHQAEVRDSRIYGCFAFSGARYFLGLGSASTILLRVDLDRRVHSVGFSMSDEADWGTNRFEPPHILRLNNGEVFSLTNGVPYTRLDENSSFIGVVSKRGFTSFTIEYPVDGIGTGLGADAIGIDDIIIAKPVRWILSDGE